MSERDAREAAAAAAAAGARVLVLCNTVRRAHAAVAALREGGGESLLWRPQGAAANHTPPYHSRYTAPDRLALDAAISARFGKDAAATTGGVILVATQVAEQSLDVDFDLLVTDLCPVDVLLQRVGRLHRHRARDQCRPAEYGTPSALVIAPEGGSFTPHLERRSLQLGWGENRPYRHFADGELTLRAIAASPEITIPADNRRLVESVYHAEAREPLWTDPAWERKMFDTAGIESNLAWAGEQAALDFDQTYTACAAAFDAAREANIRTRLGDETIRIELPEPVHCWYSTPAAPICHVDLPAWALPGGLGGTPGQDELEWLSAANEPARFRLGRREYTYDPHGWIWSG